MRVTGIGEILWDQLPSGRVLGGAPFNVTAHLARLGHQTAYLTAVGDDQPGQAAIAEARARGIGTVLIQVTRAAPTGTARVTARAAAPPPCGSTGRPPRRRHPPSPSKTPSAPETPSPPGCSTGSARA